MVLLLVLLPSLAVAQNTISGNLVPPHRTTPGLLIAGGQGGKTSVEFWLPNEASCILPNLTSPMDDGPSVDVVEDRLVACEGSTCFHLASTGWQQVAETVTRRRSHTSAVMSEGLLLVGGWGPDAFTSHSHWSVIPHSLGCCITTYNVNVPLFPLALSPQVVDPCVHVPPRWSPGRRPTLGGRGGALGPRGQGPGRSLVAAEVVRKRWGRPVQ